MQQRRQKITELVNREGQITFARLKEAFPDMSEMTLRTDLKCLDEAGAIIRIHGGAKSIESCAFFMPRSCSCSSILASKRLAAACLACVSSEETSCSALVC